ncbi:nuclear transport factor 2 family protein [Sphingomonas canadensis]|uniref:Nuclear transport factor 2 family protein n=1 Tax=Sphingomonas canadensis TaxID=1219257 RepID=A0ABW3HBA9_9SPHN|nr:nuclear transport factor 2 family protein [Sphingomonas canadensis]MCW3838102.1 nuclear transport factor 2 family protein [Sphingomonas canadensis]
MNHTESAIRAVALAYYEAMVSGDGPALRRLFDPSAHFHGLRDGAEVRRGLDAFVAMVEEPAPDGPRSVSVDLVDHSGPVATVRVTDLFRGRRYTDYLLLADPGSGWKIVAKLFHAHAPESADA